MTALTLLRCPSCGSSLEESGLDLARGLGKCAHCGALMTLPAREGAVTLTAAATRERPPHALPRRVRVTTTADGFTLERRWFQPVALILIPFCAAWIAFLCMWYSAGSSAPRDVARWMFVLPVFHVAVGIALPYCTLALLVNSTRVDVARGQLSVSHGPLPWRGARSAATADVEQLYCKRKSSRDDSGSDDHEVWVRLRDGSTYELLATRDGPEEALAIEQHIERALGIADREVPGELAR